MAAADGCGTGPVWQGKLSWVLRSLLVVGRHAVVRVYGEIVSQCFPPTLMVSLSIAQCEGVTPPVVRGFSGEIVPWIAVGSACLWGEVS